MLKGRPALPQLFVACLLPVLLSFVSPSRATAQVMQPFAIGNGIAVSTSPSVDPNRPPNSGPYSVMFTVKNYGSSQTAVYFSCTVSGPVTCSGPSPEAAGIAAGATKSVYVTYSTTSGSGAAGVTLVAEPDVRPPGTPATSWATRYTTVVAGPAGGKGIPMLAARAAENVDRGRCLTVGAGEHAGLSCGDLIITEAMPAYRTMGQDRRIALHYNSATATGLTLVPVKFVEPLSIAAPNSVRVLLTVGSAKDSLSFATPYSDCGYVGCVDSFQVAVGRSLPALPTGVHDATVTLRNIYSSSCLCDSTLPTQVLVVNRSTSEYGKGWSLLGIEQLIQSGDTTRMTWIAGDGSARVYHRGTPVTAAMLSNWALGSFNATAAVDNSTSTVAWTTGSTGSRFKADFGVPRTVTTLAIYNSGSGTAPFNVQYSDNSGTWVNVVTNVRLVNGWREVTWANAGAHRYWQLYQTAPSTGTPSVREVSFGRTNTWYGAPGDAPDSLVQVGATYVRHLKHGSYVTFDASGKHISTTNRTGQQTVMAWTTVAGQPRLASITVPPNTTPARTYSFQWNSTTGMLQSITDPAGRVLKATITNGRLMKLVAPGNLDSTRYAYDARGVLVKRIVARQPGTTKGDSAVTTYTYAHNARVTQVEIQADSAGTQFETTAITPWDDRTVTAPVQADSLGPATRVDGPITGTGDAVDILVGAFGQPVRIAQLGLSTVTRIRYDSSQTLPALATEVRYPHPTTAGAVGKIVRLTWNDRGNLVQQRDSTAHLGSIGGPTDSTTYTYGDPDAPDSPSSIRNGAGETLMIGYNSLGLPASTTDARGHVTAYHYLSSGPYEGSMDTVTERHVMVWSEADKGDVDTSLARHFTYDNAGNLSTDSLPTGVLYSYLNDNTGAVKQVDDPIGMRRRFGYDALGRVVKDTVWTAPQTAPHLTGCDPDWFMCAVADSARPVNAGIPSMLITSYVHSPSGLVSITDPRQVSRSWRHDARGNVVGATDDYGATTRSVIGVDGLVAAIISRTGDSVAYSYDAIGRLASLSYPARSAAPYGTVSGGTITYTYDKLGRMTKAQHGSASVKRGWYANGTLANEVSVGAGYDSLGYRYDAIGRLTIRLYQNAGGTKDTVRYTYGSAGDLDSLIVKWGGPTGFTDPRVFRYTWDALGRRKSISYPLTGGMSVAYSYDAAGTIRQILASHPQHSTTAPELADSFSLRRPVVDPLGRVLYERASCPSTATGSPCTVPTPEEWNAFNRLGWLVRQARKSDFNIVIDSLRYDGSGNIIWRRPDQVKAAKSYTIGAGHNRIEKVAEAGAGDLHFEYLDDGSRSIEWRDTLATGAADSRRYYYNSLGRTSGIIFVHGDLYGNPETLGSISTCVSDPLGRPVQPCTEGLLLGLDGENIVRVQDWSIASGPGLDDPVVALYRQSGVTKELYFLTDGQGRHLLATEVGGGMDQTLATSSTYSGWRSTGAATIASGYGANRLNTDETPNLAFYRNRIYDQRSGSWTQEDPLGVAGGLNLYQFNGNNPASYRDPFGLCVPMPACLLLGAGADGGAVALSGTATTVSAGTIATVAAPMVVAAGLAYWASLPVHQAPTFHVPGSLVQSDATAVARTGDPVGTAGGERAGKPFTPKAKDAIRGPEGTPCEYCGRATTRTPGPTQSQGDHVVPRAQGGNGSPDNGVNACATCNGEKGNRTPEQWNPRWYDPK